MELIFYRKLLSLVGGLIIIIDLANTGMVPIGHPNNAGNRPPFGKPLASPGMNTSPSVTVHGRPDRPGVNNGHGPQSAMSFGIQQKPPHPSSYGSSQSSVGNSQSHLIYTQNTAGPGAEPVMIVSSSQNAMNETENTHTVPLEQMASILSISLTPPQEENSGNSQGPHPQAQDTVLQISANHVENLHQNEAQTVSEIVPLYSENSPSNHSSANHIIAVHVETTAHLPSEIQNSQNEILVASNPPENILLSETNQINTATDVIAELPSSSLEVSQVAPHAVSSHAIVTQVSSPSHADDDDHEHHFDLEAYLAQANMVLGTSNSNVQPVQSTNVQHPAENMEPVEVNVVEASVLPTSSVSVPEASHPATSQTLVPEAIVPSTSQTLSEASVPPTAQIAVPEANVPISVPAVDEPVPQIVQLAETVSAEIQEPVPENLQLAETPSVEIQEPLPIPPATEIENSQNEIITSHVSPVSEENLSNVIPDVLSEQAILSMPNEVFEESVLNIELSHENNVAQSQSNNHESGIEQLSEPIIADVSPVAPITMDHNEHLSIPANSEVSVSNAEEALPLLSETSQVAPNSPVVNVQLEEVLPEVQETNASPSLPPLFSVTPEETAVNTAEVATSPQSEDTIDHSPLNVEAQNIYSSPVEHQSDSTSEDYDDPPFNVEQYLAQAALLLGSKSSYQPYVHDDQQGSANDLYYSDKQNFQQSSDHFGKDKTDSGIVKGNQYYTHFGNKFTSSHGTGREQPKENNANNAIVDESKASEQVKSSELSNKTESLAAPKSQSSHPHAADTRPLPLPGPPHLENLDENMLLTVAIPGNENQLSGMDMESQELPAESKSVPEEVNQQSFSSKHELERARPFRPGFARPSSLGLAPMYSYSGGVLNTPLGEDIKLTEYSNIVPAVSKNPNATAAAEPVKFPHNALMPLLGSSSFNSYFNGSHTNISVPNPAASFIMAQAPSVPSPQAPNVQHTVLNNSNIVSSMNSSQMKPTEFQSYYFPQESVKFANVLMNNGGIQPIVGSKNIEESKVVFMVHPKPESEAKGMQDDFGSLNPEQSAGNLLAHDRKKALGNNHFVKRASSSGKSLDKNSNRVTDSVKEEEADSGLEEEPAAAEEMEDTSEKANESQSSPKNTVDLTVSDNLPVQEEKEDTSVSDLPVTQDEEQPDETLNREVESQPLEEQKEDNSDNESDSQPASAEKDDDSETESDSQLASEQKEENSDSESESRPASEKEDGLNNESDTQPILEKKEDSENESESEAASEQKEYDSENEPESLPASEKEDDLDNESDSQPISEEKDADSGIEPESPPPSEEKQVDSENESDSQLESIQKEDDSNDDSQSNEKQELDSHVQQENVVTENQSESEVQETENPEKKKEADASSLEEDEYETSEEEETQIKDSENYTSNTNEESEITYSEKNSHKGTKPKSPVGSAPSKPSNQETTKVKQPVAKEETAPAKVVPSKENPSKTQSPPKDSPPKGQIPAKETPPKAQAPMKENPPKSQAPPKDTPQKGQAPSKEAPPKESPPKSQAPSKEAPQKESLPKTQQAPLKEAPPKESLPKAQAPPKEAPPKPQNPSQETPPKPQAPSKEAPPKDPPPTAQAPPPSPPQKDAGPPAAGPSGPGLPPMPEPPALISPPSIEAMAPPSLDQLQFSIPELQFSIPEPNIYTPTPAMPPDVSEVIGMVNIPSFPTIGDKGSKGIPNPKPKPPKRPSTSNGSSKGSPQAQQNLPPDSRPHVNPQAQQNPPPDSRPHVNPQAPAILQQEILEAADLYEEPEELSAAEMAISEELENVEEEDESMNISEENEIQPQFEDEPVFTNEKALPSPSKNSRPNFPPGFSNPSPPNPMFGNPAYGPGAFPQVIPGPGPLPGSNPDKACTCNSNSAPGGGNAGGNSNSNGSGKPNANNNANNDKGSSNSGGKPNASNSGNNDKGNNNGVGKPSASNSNNDKGSSNNGKHPSVPSKHNPAPTAAPVPAPVIDMDSEDDSNSNVRPPRPTKPKRPNRPNSGGKKPKPKPNEKNNDKLKDVEVEDEIDPELLQQALANNTNIVFTPPKITDSKLENKPAANNVSSSVSHNTPTKQTELFTIYSIFGWEIPVINWSYFTDIFQSFFVEKFRTSSGEFTCDESDNEATILRSELDVDYLCGDDIDYGRRDIRTLADSNICNMFCNSNGYSSGLCMPQKSCLCYMSEKKNFAIKLDRLADFTSNSTEKESSNEEDTCQNCRCLKSCQNNGKYVGYCSKSCHCGVPWYNENPEITQSSSPQA